MLSADAVLARWYLWPRFPSQELCAVSPSALSIPFFWLPPPTCKNRTSLSLSICLWDTLKRIQKAERGLNFIIFIYFSRYVSFLKTVPASFGRRTVFSSLQMNISMICVLQFGAEGEGNGKKTSSLHSRYALQYFPLRNPLQLAVSDSIRYWKMHWLFLCFELLFVWQGWGFFGWSPLNSGLAMNRGCFHKPCAKCSWKDLHHALSHYWLK